jgi:hypothetical protein
MSAPQAWDECGHAIRDITSRWGISRNGVWVKRAIPSAFLPVPHRPAKPQSHPKGALPPSEPLGSCELLMPVVFRGAAIGGVLALVVQACGPTPLGAVVRGAFVVPAHAAKSTAAPGIQGNAGSLPHLQISRCLNAVCAGR